jgi:hypothetical protein
MERGIDIERRRKYQKSTDCQAGRPEAGTDKNSSSQDQLEYAAKQDHQPSLRHTSGQHVHHLLGFREMAKRSKEEHGGDPNATGKRLIRAAEYCDQKSAEQQTRDNHHVLHR